MPSLKFSVDPLYTFPGPAQTSFPVVGPARYLRGVCGAGTGAAPSCNDEVPSVAGMAPGTAPPSTAWAPRRSIQHKSGTLLGPKEIKPSQRVERFDRNRL